MPYMRKGRDIYTKSSGSSGKWRLKQHCSSVANAEKALRLLRGIEHNPEFKRKIARKKK